MSTTADNQTRVTQAIADYMRRVDAGEAVDSEQFIKSHPEVAAELKRYLDNVALIEEMAGPTPAEQSQSPADAARRETVSASQGGDSVPQKQVTVVSGPVTGQFGRYHIEKTLGEGAMGTVYLATDTQLHRRVALKVPKFKDDDTEMMERFYREARSAAKLRHRHICPVHDIGEIDGIKYISIAYIEGRPLSDYVSADKPQSERNVAVIVRKLALALDVAHREGVIHRDLKPANVMVDKKTEPVIMDFGLARQMNTQENERLTQTGTIMGSPAYMSPEQVNADNDKIGPCSDVYSLGVMLYELLTGNLPFEGSIAAVIGQILLKEPDKPSTFRPDLDPRLEEICAKMMAKEIGERYASMKDVAAALTAFLKNPTKPGEKRSVGKLESFAPVELQEVSKKSKTNRRTVAREKSTPKPAETFATKDKASGGRKPAEAPKQQSVFDRLKSLPRSAWAIAATCVAIALLWAITLIFKAGNQTIEIAIDDPNATVTIEGAEVTIVSRGDEGFGTFTGKLGKFDYEWKLERDGETISGTGSFTLKKGMKTPIQIVTRKPPPPDDPRPGPRVTEWVTALHHFDDAASVKAIPNAISFWPGGESIVDTYGSEKRLRRRDALTGEAIDYKFADEISSGVESLAFSADEKLLAVGKSDGKILIWDLTMNRIKKAHQASMNPVRGLSFSSDGDRVLGYANSTNTTAEIVGWDFQEGKAIDSFSISCYLLNFGRSIAFSLDGKHVAAVRIAGRKDGIVELWEIANGQQPVRSFDTTVPKTLNAAHAPIYSSIVFSPDGQRLIACSDGGSSHKNGFVNVWEVASGREILTCKQRQTGTAVASSHDGRWIVSSDFLPRGVNEKAVGTLYVWDAQTGRKMYTTTIPAVDSEGELRAKRIEFSPHGKRFFTAGQNTPLTVWALTPQSESPAPQHASDLPAGQWVRLLENDEQFKQWQATNCDVKFAEGTVTLADMENEQKTERGDGRLERLFDTTAQRFIVHIRHNKLSGHMAGEDVVVGSQRFSSSHFGVDGHELWAVDDSSSKGSSKLSGNKSKDGYADFADFDYVVIDGEFSTYLNGKKIHNLKRTAAPLTAITLDIRQAQGNWKDIAVMRLTDEQVAAIRAGNLPEYTPASATDALPDVLTKKLTFIANVSRFCFSPDGKQIIGFSWGDFRPWVFDAATGKPFSKAKTGWGREINGKQAMAMAVSSVDSVVVVGNRSGRLMLWNYETGEIQHDLVGHSRMIQEVVFTPDGKQIVSSANDHTIRFWNTANGQQERVLAGAEKVTEGNSLAISPAGQHFVEGGANQLNFRDVSSGNIIWTKTEKDPVFYNEAAFSSDGKRLATFVLGSDPHMLILDVADGTVVSRISQIPEGSGKATELRFLADDQLLLSTHPGASYVWSVPGEQLLQELQHANAADVSPDGRFIVGKGPELSARLWQVDDEKLKQALAGPTITANNATYATLRSGSWQSVFSKADDIPQDKGITFKDGKITLDDRKLRIQGLHARNVALRARIRKESGSRGFSIHVRSKVNSKNDDGTIVVPNNGFDSDYAFWVHGPKTSAGINRFQPGQKVRKELTKGTLHATGREFELLVAAIDDRLLYFVDGKLALETRDSNISAAGEIVLGSYSAKFIMSNVAVRVLDDVDERVVQPAPPSPPQNDSADLTHVAQLDGTAISPYATFALAISRDGSLLVDSLTTDGLLRARKVATGELTQLPFQSPQNVTAAAFSADGETLLFGTSEGKVYVQSLQAGRRAIELIPAHPVVRKLAFDTAGRVLVFSNGAARRSEGAVQRFIVSTRKESSIVRFPQNLGYNPCLVSFTADGSRVAIVNDKRAILYDLDTAKELPVKFQPHLKLPSIAYGWATGVTLSPDSTRLMTWGYDMRAHVSDGVTGERILPPLLHMAQVKPPDLPSHLTVSRGLFSPDRRWFVNSYMSGVSGATLPGEIVVRDTATGEEIASEIIPNAPSTGKSKYNESYVTRLILSDDGRFLAAAGSAMKIHVWRIDQQNRPTADALARTISVDFRRKPFAEAMQEIGKLAGIEIRVDEEGLKSQGYTLNMSQNVRMNDKTVQDVIEAIVRRYRKMSWRINGNHILVTAGDSSQAANGTEFEQLTAGNWTRVLNKRSEFSKVPDARMTPTGTLLLGTVVKDGDAHVGIRDATGDDYLQAGDFALRLKAKRLQGRNFYFLFRQVKSNGYVVSTNGRDTISAIRKIGFAGLKRQITGPQPIEVDDTDWVEWMLVARGKTMTVYADGREVLTFSDSDFQTGGIAVGADQSRMQFKEIELQLLESGNADSTAVPPKNTPSRQWLAPKVNSDEIKSALAGLLKNGFFGRPPSIKAMEKYVSAEVKRRKEDGRMSPNAKFEYRFNSVGKIVFESVSDSPIPSGQNNSGTARASDLKVVMYKEGKPRTFPTFGHLRIGLAILSNPDKNPPGRKTFRMTIEHGDQQQEFTDPVKARTALLAKLKELDDSGKPYTINGKPAESRGTSGSGKKKGGGGGFGGGGFGGRGKRKK